MKLEDLKAFIEKSKALYGQGLGEVPKGKEQRPGFKELKYKDGDWEMVDSYSGFYSAPGQEVIRYKGVPVWHMAYGGKGQEEKYYELAGETFTFLKEVLSKAEESMFRGNKSYKKEEWRYKNKQKGDYKNFSGEEKIFYKGKLMFSQLYFGGLIIQK